MNRSVLLRAPRWVCGPAVAATFGALLTVLPLAHAHAAPPSGPSANTEVGGRIRVHAEVHRVFDDRVILSVPVTPEEERVLAAGGLRRCSKAAAASPAQDGGVLCRGRMYAEYRVAEQPLLLALLAAQVGKVLVLELERADGHTTVVDAHRAE